jgi:hypothetical protein
MDTTLLVNQVKSVIHAFELEGKMGATGSLVQVYPGYESSPYMIALSCPWMVGYSSSFLKTKEVTLKFRHVITPEKMKNIYSINVFGSENEYFDFLNDYEAILV